MYIGTSVAITLFVIAVLFVVKSIRVVPQQHACIVERLGKYECTLQPGLRFLIPFVDKVAYKHSLKEMVLDMPTMVAVTKDNTQIKVDGVLYFQVTDPMKASYGSANYVLAIGQLAQTSLRSAIGKMQLDETFENREQMNTAVVTAVTEAAQTWGVKVVRYEVKDLVPPENILKAMQQQITAEREKRARIAESEGKKQEQINLAEGLREAAIKKSEGEKAALKNHAEGQAAAIKAVADATADALEKVGESLGKPGGKEAMTLKVAEQAVSAFGQLAKSTNTMILPADMSNIAGLMAGVMGIVQRGSAALGGSANSLPSSTGTGVGTK